MIETMEKPNWHVYRDGIPLEKWTQTERGRRKWMWVMMAGIEDGDSGQGGNDKR